MNPSSDKKIIEALKSNPLFSILEQDQLERLRSTGSLRSFQAGTMVLSEGDYGESFFLVVEGVIRVYKDSQSSVPILIALVKPGEIFAEVVVVEDIPYPFSAIALDSTHLFAINRSVFRKLLQQEDFRDLFLSSLFQRIQYMAQLIENLSTMDVEERFFRFLFERYGKNSQYTIEMSKRDLATSMGTIPETLSRLIRRLTAEGILTWEGRQIQLRKDFWNESDYSWLREDPISFHLFNHELPRT